MSFLSVPETGRADGADDLFPEDLFADGEYGGDLSELLAQPDEESGEAASRHTDTRLQTPYTSKKLQSRLLSRSTRPVRSSRSRASTCSTSRSACWSGTRTRRAKEPPGPAPPRPRRAHADGRPRPLPPRLHRRRRRGNLSLQTKLKTELRDHRPPPGPRGRLDVEAYFDAVADAVADEPRWRVDGAPSTSGSSSSGSSSCTTTSTSASGRTARARGPRGASARSSATGSTRPRDGSTTTSTSTSTSTPTRSTRSSTPTAPRRSRSSTSSSGHHLVIQGPPGTGKSPDHHERHRRGGRAGEVRALRRREDGGARGRQAPARRRPPRRGLPRAPQPQDQQEGAARRAPADAQAGQAARPTRWPPTSTCSSTRATSSTRTPTPSTPPSGRPAFGPTTRTAACSSSGRWDGIEPPHLRRRDGGLDAADYARRRARVEGSSRSSARWAVPPSTRSGAARGWRSSPPSSGSSWRPARPRPPPEALAERPSARGLPRSQGRHARRRSVICRAARRALSAPDLRGVRVDAGEWPAREPDVEALRVGTPYAAIHAATTTRSSPRRGTQDVLETRQHLAAHGEKWYRVFIGDWRRAKSAPRGALDRPLPERAGRARRLLDAVLEAQRLGKEIESYASLGSGLFGLQWQAARSDWAVLRADRGVDGGALRRRRGRRSATGPRRLPRGRPRPRGAAAARRGDRGGA